MPLNDLENNRLDTWCCNICNRPLCDISHESNDGEDDKASKHACAWVYAAHYDGVPEMKVKCFKQSVKQGYCSSVYYSSFLWKAFMIQDFIVQVSFHARQVIVFPH